MTRWSRVVLITLASWTSTAVLAQGPYVPAGYAGPPPGALPGPPNPQMWHGYGDWQGQPAWGTPSGGWCPPGGSYGPQYTQELVPDHTNAWYGPDRPHHRINEVFRGSWFRADYLLWSIEGPGDTLVGSPMSTTDPRSVFRASDPVTGVRLDDQGQQFAAINASLGGTFLRNQNTDNTGIGLVPGLPADNRAAYQIAEGADHGQLNGARIAGGIPIFDEAFELEAWTLQQSNNLIQIDPTSVTAQGITTNIIPAITLLEAGSPSDTAMLLFSNGLRVDLNATMWGTEGNWVFRPVTPNTHIEIFPMLGFRYTRFGEKMNISGADISGQDDAGADIVLNHRIGMDNLNHIFGPQIGLRMLMETKYLTLGFEPKLAAGFNKVKQALYTQEIYRPTVGGTLVNSQGLAAEDPRYLTDEFTRFAPILDLAFYAKAHVTENFSLNVGYDFTLTGSVYRAYDSIAYNNADPSATPEIGISRSRSSMYVHGLMVGGEWLLP
ncbi:MAG: BBP7 family outer membrane beta-barrel protein [Planctomycetaceae bacterium]|nr:BBP7 family outer membrane beta-barrel protein [Planctomycetaceae bacterium]